MTVKVVKGTVVVEGDVSADIVPLLIAKAKNRTRLEIWRASLPDMDLLSDLITIEHLSIVNCKVVDSSALPRVCSIRSLFINGSTFRQGLGFIASMEGLEALHLLNLRGSVTVPELSTLARLVSVRVWGCSGLTDLRALATAPNLRDVALVATGLEPESLLPLFRHPTLVSLDSQFATQAKQRTYTGLLAEFGKTRFNA